MRVCGGAGGRGKRCPSWVDERVSVPLNRSSTLTFRPTCWREGGLARPQQAEEWRQVGQRRVLAHGCCWPVCSGLALAGGNVVSALFWGSGGWLSIARFQEEAPRG